MKRYVLIIIVIFFTVSCTTKWTRVGGMYEASEQNFSVDLPNGWMKWNTDEGFLITRDGVLLQNVNICRLDISKEFKHTKKKLRKDMLSQEISEVILDNIAMDNNIMNYQMLENIPVKIDNHSGFKATFSYKTGDGLKIKGEYYGFLVGEYFYGMQYTAAQRYYYDLDAETFERIVMSFKVRIKT